MTRQPILKKFTFSPSWIVYQDNDILVVNKPPGLLSVPGKGAFKNECLTAHLQQNLGDCLIVHRLDMDTSGLMVLAKNKLAHRHLSIQFQDRLTHKTYQALCTGHISQDAGVINLPMRCDWEKRPLQMIDFKQGKFAQTLWQKVTQHPTYWQVALTPITGRAHQLRLHLKMLGHPILGDNLYADDATLAQAPRLCLHANTLSFTHPTSQQKLQFSQEADFQIN